MKILDRYIIKLFVMNFVILFFVIMSLFVLIDFISDMDVFLRAGNANAELNDSWMWLETLKALMRYEVPMIIVLYTFLSGLLINGAMGFTLTHLNRKRELVAIVASGISLYRVALPMILTGLFLAVLNLPIQEYVLPSLAQQLTESKSEVLKQVEKKMTLVLKPDSQGNFFHAAKMVDDGDDGFHLISLKIFDHNNQKTIQRVVTASQADWDEEHKRWDLTDGYAKYPEIAGEKNRNDRIDEVAYFETDLSPKLIRSMSESRYARLLSIGELNELPYTKSLGKMGIIQLIHGRFSIVFVNMLVFVVALSYFLSREPDSSLLKSIKASGVTLVLWGLGVGVIQVGIVPGNPLASAWLPVFILIPVAVYFWNTIKT